MVNYTKTCPPLPRDCSIENVYVKDCCKLCNSVPIQKSKSSSMLKDHVSIYIDTLSPILRPIYRNGESRRSIVHLPGQLSHASVQTELHKERSSSYLQVHIHGKANTLDRRA